VVAERDAATAKSAPRWRRTSDALVRRTPVSLLIAGAGMSAPVKLEGGAIALWRSLDVPRTLAELIVDVASTTGTTPATVASDVERTLAALVDCGVVTQA
jgi:hypothetical protein